MPSQEIINQKNSTANAEQVSESNLELVPQPKQEHDTAASPRDCPMPSSSCPLVRKRARRPLDRF